MRRLPPQPKPATASSACGAAARLKSSSPPRFVRISSSLSSASAGRKWQMQLNDDPAFSPVRRQAAAAAAKNFLNSLESLSRLNDNLLRTSQCGRAISWAAALDTLRLESRMDHHDETTSRDMEVAARKAPWRLTPETDPRFPSGEWKGFWVQKEMRGRQWMRLALEFSGGKISGQGQDIIGKF